MTYQKKRPALVVTRKRGRSISSQQKNTSEFKAYRPENQPVAMAVPLGGICYSLRVHHVGGAIEHKGLFSDSGAANLAAHELNILFQQEGGVI